MASDRSDTAKPARTLTPTASAISARQRSNGCATDPETDGVGCGDGCWCAYEAVEAEAITMQDVARVAAAFQAVIEAKERAHQ